MPQKNLIEMESVRDFIETMGGKDLVTLVKICEKKRKAFTDEVISKQMGIKVTEVRAMLNKLHFRGIVCYQKSRNQKTGWFNYTWELKKDRLAGLLIDKQKENLVKLQQKKSIEGDYNHFDCNNCSERMPFEVAAEYNFICPSCGGVMDLANNPKKQKEILKKIEQLEKEIKILSEIN
jgi:transcription initiation factor TFIIE subunit alpha